MSEFEGKVAIVTGAGNGLGRAHAKLLASLGAKVVVNDLGGNVDGTGSGDAADKVVQEIVAAGGEAVANKASVADRDGAKSIVTDAVDAFGTVDILVNNAGILRDKSFKNMTLDDWDIVMDVHINGTAYVTHAAWPIMYEKNYGRIVCTSSTSGIFGNFGQANYGAAKMAMLGFMNVLALEGASHNVRVNCLAPGANTRMIQTIPGRDGPSTPEQQEESAAAVSPAIVLMCREDAPNGRVIHASGGRFSSSAIFVNEGVSLGMSSQLDDVLGQSDSVLDMENARMFVRQQRRRG